MNATGCAAGRALIGLAAALAASIATAAEPLATTTVDYREVDRLYSVDAVVEAVKQSTVSAQVPGRVVEINFDAGDFVKKGEVIVRIDEREVNEAYLGAQAQVAQVRAQFINAQASLERSERLFAQKFVSQAALDRARAEYEAAKAQLDAAVAQGRQAATVKGHATVVAPYSGVVAQRHVELGEMAVPGKPLMTGFDPRDLRVAANVPQDEVAAVRKATAAQVEFPVPGRTVQGGAIAVLPAADAHTHTTRVRVALPEYAAGTYPGMFARVHFSIGRARKLAVPATAVVRRNELTAVYVVAPDGGIKLRQVRLGDPAGEAGIEVLAGLNPGDKVALDPVRAAMVAAGAPAAR